MCNSDPESVAGGWWLVAGGGWDWFYNKTNGFSSISVAGFNFSVHLHKEHYKTNPASIGNPDPESVAGCPLPVARYWFYSKTNGFSTISVAGSIKPMLF